MPVFLLCCVSQALWALGNISGDGPQLKQVVLNAGIFWPLMEILKVKKETSVISAAVWVLSHLCKGSSARDEVRTDTTRT